MDIASQVYREVQQLPDFLAKEVLDFIGYIGKKHGLNMHGTDGLKAAQEKVMHDIWSNPEDDVWNEM